MEAMKFCQSCGMPMGEELYGTEADGGKSCEYCRYCYEQGKFTADVTMEEMIEFCVPHMVAGNPNMTEQAARQMMGEVFPQLKRWKR